ncbi:hypothetical protein RHMOL_Rhmol13G0055800 [Rhododendron molle]|uniref:Uncharacterized protein n=1 Tax=Rhododendron molle TaxID=49168 RepID=A0ACC0L4T4_RHOML|nr:hypothetical protein RHMOL_Rhmol13G0055800 [Rhododendron molle]
MKELRVGEGEERSCDCRRRSVDCRSRSGDDLDQQHSVCGSVHHRGGWQPWVNWFSLCLPSEGHKVSLNVYDLSQGMARQLSTSFLGRAIEGIWHTGVVVYGNEYYFGGGVQHSLSGKTPYGTPIRVVNLGVTHVPKDVFEMYLQEISPRYSAGTYNLLSHNCNNFSNEVAQFLVGATIPDFILNLPNEIRSSPMGAVILPMIQQLETTMRSGAVPHAPQFLPPRQVQTSQPTVAAKKSVASSGYKSSTTQAEAKEGKGKVKSEDQGNVVPPPIILEHRSCHPSIGLKDVLGMPEARCKRRSAKNLLQLWQLGLYVLVRLQRLPPEG